jgi:oligopeptidase B
MWLAIANCRTENFCRMRFCSFLIAGVFRAFTPLVADASPPLAAEKPHEIKEGGLIRTDPFFWLRDKQNPEVLKYLEAENRYTETALKPAHNFQETLYREMRGRIKEEDLSVPERIGEFYYYTRTETGKQYAIYCRKKGGLNDKEEILLDENALAEGLKYFRVGSLSVSPNHKLLAYSTDTKGDERYVFRIKDLETGKLLPDEIKNSGSSFAWANDNKTFFYDQLDGAHRPFKAMKHILGMSTDQDSTIYQENDERFFLEISKSRSRKLIFVSVESELSSEVRFLDADQPDAELTLIRSRENDLLYDVEHHGNRLFIVTNENAKNFKVVEAPLLSPSKEYWKDFIPYDPQIKVDGIDAFENNLVVAERIKGLQTIRVYDLKSGESHEISFDEPSYEVSIGHNPEFNTSAVRLQYSSFITPPSVIDYDMVSRQKELRKEQAVLGGFRKSDYGSDRIFAQADDGTSIPISIFYKRGFRRDGTAPLWLNGYGAYGIPTDASFSSNSLSLVNRGFAFAIAHVRGGGELGRTWYEDGKLLKKKNTFTDFIRCTEFLVQQGYVSPKKIAICGGSAGGLLMGAVMNMRPDLFTTVIAAVPFVDVLNTMSDPTLPLTITEYEEWGNPKDQKYLHYIASYSPYDNIREEAYPNLLAIAGLNDSRVSYWEPAKWVAKQRRLKNQNRILLLKTNMGAGHGGESGRFDRLKEVALEYAFAIDTLHVDRGASAANPGAAR